MHHHVRKERLTDNRTVNMKTLHEVDLQPEMYICMRPVLFLKPVMQRTLWKILFIEIRSVTFVLSIKT